MRHLIAAVLAAASTLLAGAAQALTFPSTFREQENPGATIALVRQFVAQGK
jgi:hypothetical protein